MKKLDLEKAIILLCLLGIPVVGGWIYKMQGELEEADSALKTCKTMITRIHGLHDLIQRTKEEVKEAGDLGRPDLYFENRAMASQKGAPVLKREDIRISTVGERGIRKGGTGPVIGKDIEVKVEFGIARGRRGMPLSRSFINAFIVNCESHTPIWRLRNLKITNKSFKSLRSNQAPSDLELPDEWIVDELVFARRAPEAAN